MKTTTAIRKLAKLGIRTTADLDAYCRGKLATPTCIPSRHGALVKLVGDDAAMWILNDLAIRQCCPEPGKARR